MRDLAAMFEYFTDNHPTRTVDRGTGDEAGQFYTFAAAMWPVILGNGDAGLSAAMKAWADARIKFPEEVSPVIANMRLRGVLGSSDAW
jgi:hypothetical protein